jgi:hypothetical protein
VFIRPDEPAVRVQQPQPAHQNVQRHDHGDERNHGHDEQPDQQDPAAGEGQSRKGIGGQRRQKQAHQRRGDADDGAVEQEAAERVLREDLHVVDARGRARRVRDGKLV